MHIADDGRVAPELTHHHAFLGADHARNERRTLIVVGVTLVTMVVEIVAGWAYGSMALTADGWHMATHAGAIGLAALAYRFAARHAADPAYAFGAGKVGDLAGFASAIVLGLVALAIGWESFARLADPQPVAYAEATVVAVIGLAVNVGCALLLGHGAGHSHHGHGHDHGHRHAHDHDHDHHGHDHDHHDHNLRGAYLHVLADALTSALAIGGLLVGWRSGWSWIDPAIGVVGAAVIGWWSVSLARDTARVLVDATPDAELGGRIRGRLEIGDARVTDLHLWRVGPGHMAVIASVATHEPLEPATCKARLAGLAGLSHVTIEVNRCAGET
ncbi:CDF family Co(II)/Ni(II) efflux transporter DmeF [Methylopila turkensis]|uniref:Cation efflux system protein n=1 Tax=Methylopila turkensis TaxID=1437816 RepID=A0A9W6N5M3_9HYPH|nr:CDF family Co(II)/Ni(II) efflux transporter DmeF [Methylopila turkensis]GLK78595.1 cation efflux system protein [Methylopila turkensis]